MPITVTRNFFGWHIVFDVSRQTFKLLDVQGSVIMRLAAHSAVFSPLGRIPGSQIVNANPLNQTLLYDGAQRVVALLAWTTTTHVSTSNPVCSQ
jgi:hypothetical protein